MSSLFQIRPRIVTATDPNEEERLNRMIFRGTGQGAVHSPVADEVGAFDAERARGRLARILRPGAVRPELPPPPPPEEEDDTPLATPAADKLREEMSKPIERVQPTKWDRVLAGITGGARGWNSAWTGERPGAILDDVTGMLDRRDNQARALRQEEMNRLATAAKAEDQATENRVRDEVRKTQAQVRREAVHQREERARLEHQARTERNSNDLVAKLLTGGKNGAISMFEAGQTPPEDSPFNDAKMYTAIPLPDGRMAYAPTGAHRPGDLERQVIEKSLGIKIDDTMSPDDTRLAMSMVKHSQAMARDNNQHDNKMDIVEKQLDAIWDRQSRALAAKAGADAVRAHARLSKLQGPQAAVHGRLTAAKNAADQKSIAAHGAAMAKLAADQADPFERMKPEDIARRRAEIDKAKEDSLLQSHNSYVNALNALTPGLELPVYSNYAALQEYTRVRHGLGETPPVTTPTAPPAPAPVRAPRQNNRERPAITTPAITTPVAKMKVTQEAVNEADRAVGRNPDGSKNRAKIAAYLKNKGYDVQ